VASGQEADDQAVDQFTLAHQHAAEGGTQGL
jgi:hypothetical protein